MMQIKRKNYISVALIIIFSVAFLVTSVLFKVYGITGILAQLTGTLLGTIITAIVTLLLLSVQTNKELEHEKDSRVFEKKQEIYHNFLKELEEITKDGKITVDDNKDELQKLIYQLGLLQMHADKDVAERITAYVGELLGIINRKSETLKNKSEKNTLDPKKYTDLSEKLFNIVKLLRSDLYGNSMGIIDPDYFYITLVQSGCFEGRIRNAETMKRLHEKWWNLFIDILTSKRKKLESLVFYYNFGPASVETSEECIEHFENRENVQLNFVLRNQADCRICFYMDFSYQSPINYGFMVESEGVDEEKAQKNRKYMYALPNDFKHVNDKEIGSKAIDSKYDIDFYGTNKNYFDFAKANEDQKKEIVVAFADEINNNIEEFLKNLENK